MYKQIQKQLLRHKWQIRLALQAGFCILIIALVLIVGYSSVILGGSKIQTSSLSDQNFKELKYVIERTPRNPLVGQEVTLSIRITGSNGDPIRNSEFEFYVEMQHADWVGLTGGTLIQHDTAKTDGDGKLIINYIPNFNYVLADKNWINIFPSPSTYKGHETEWGGDPNVQTLGPTILSYKIYPKWMKYFAIFK